MAKQIRDETATGLRIYLNKPMDLIKTGFLVLTWIVLVQKNFVFFSFSIKFFVVVVLRVFIWKSSDQQ